MPGSSPESESGDPDPGEYSLTSSGSSFAGVGSSDTAQTGRNGCRSYIYASVIKATATGGGKYTYSVANEWIFNNIVKFK